MTKEKELEQITKKMQIMNQGIKQEIIDLENRISSLDSEYEAIKGIIDTKSSNLDETKNKVKQIESDVAAFKKKPTAVMNCDKSEYSFVTRKDLSSHVINLQHTKKVICKQCDTTFSTSSQLETHLQGHHGTSKKHKCEECGKKFHFRWRLDKHKAMHDSVSEIRKCHFYNNCNEKQCPFDEFGCKFLHEESSVCKYKDRCKFDKCQFRH